MSDVVGYRVAMQEERSAALRDRVQQLLAPLDGSERALDSGCGAGALAFALAPFVGSVVGVDLSEDLIAAGRELAPPNCELVVGDATALPFEYGSFDIVGCMRVLHHARRPELIVSELARVTRPGGRILLVDQLGYVDPVVSAETDRFEQARDPSHTRLLPDQDIRGYLDANDLEVLTNEIAQGTTKPRALPRSRRSRGRRASPREWHGAGRGLRGRDRLVRRAQARRPRS